MSGPATLEQLIDQLGAAGFEGDIETTYAERVVAAGRRHLPCSR